MARRLSNASARPAGRRGTQGTTVKCDARLSADSSAANVGSDKDRERRQEDAIEAFARSAGYEIVDSYYDAAVSGADPVTARLGFSAMLERLLSNGVRIILVENAGRFACDLLVAETG